MAQFDYVLGNEPLLLKPNIVQTVFKSREQRYGILRLINAETTDAMATDYNLIDGRALKPKWVDEGARKPLRRGAVSRVTVSVKKLAVMAAHTYEQARTALVDPDAWIEANLMPGFAQQLSAAALGRDGTDGTDVNVFARNLNDIVPDDADHTVTVTGTGDAGALLGVDYRDANAAADALLLARGVIPTGSVFHTHAQTAVTTQTSQIDNVFQPFRTLDDIGYGTPVVIDANLDPGTASGTTIGWRADWTGFGMKILDQIFTGRSAGAVTDDNEVIFEGQNNEIIRTYELLAGLGVIDVDKFVRIKVA